VNEGIHLCPMCRHVNENIYVTKCRKPMAKLKIKKLCKIKLIGEDLLGE
jgi:hypothetical protein